MEDKLGPTHATSCLNCKWRVTGRSELACGHRLYIHMSGACHAVCVQTYGEEAGSEKVPGGQDELQFCSRC